MGKTSPNLYAIFATASLLIGCAAVSADRQLDVTVQVLDSAGVGITNVPVTIRYDSFEIIWTGSDGTGLGSITISDGDVFVAAEIRIHPILLTRNDEMRILERLSDLTESLAFGPERLMEVDATSSEVSFVFQASPSASVNGSITDPIPGGTCTGSIVRASTSSLPWASFSDPGCDFKLQGLPAGEPFSLFLVTSWFSGIKWIDVPALIAGEDRALGNFTIDLPTQSATVSITRVAPTVPHVPDIDNFVSAISVDGASAFMFRVHSDGHIWEPGFDPTEDTNLIPGLYYFLPGLPMTQGFGLKVWTALREGRIADVATAGLGPVQVQPDGSTTVTIDVDTALAALNALN